MRVFPGNGSVLGFNFLRAEEALPQVVLANDRIFQVAVERAVRFAVEGKPLFHVFSGPFPGSCFLSNGISFAITPPALFHLLFSGSCVGGLVEVSMPCAVSS